jgi:hypothetical protein
LHRILRVGLFVILPILAIRWSRRDHPRGYWYVAWEKTRADPSSRDFSILRDFARKLPCNAALVVVESDPLDNKLLEFAADRSCHAAVGNEPEMIAQLARVGTLPCLVTTAPPPLLQEVSEDQKLNYKKLLAGDSAAQAAVRN